MHAEAKKILVMGLSSPDKAVLSNLMARRLRAVHFNGDRVRSQVNKDLGFSLNDRIEQARRVTWLCDQVVKSGVYAIADLTCPNADARRAFGEAVTVWVDRTPSSGRRDADPLFVPPERWDIRVTAEGTLAEWAKRITQYIRELAEPKAAAVLAIGHGRRTGGIDGARRPLPARGRDPVTLRGMSAGVGDPFAMAESEEHLQIVLSGPMGSFIVEPLPDVKYIFYGYGVEYTVERIDVPDHPIALAAVTRSTA